MAKATKRQSAEYREREKLRLWLISASQMTSEREKHKQRDNAVSERDLWPAASCKLLKHSLQLLKKGQITHVSTCNFSIYTHTLGGVDWERPPRGPHWDLLANYTRHTH